MGKNIRNLVGQQFGDWTVEKELGGGKVICKCSCGIYKELYKKCLLEGRTTSCGHNRKNHKPRGRIIDDISKVM